MPDLPFLPLTDRQIMETIALRIPCDAVTQISSSPRWNKSSQAPPSRARRALQRRAHIRLYFSNYFIDNRVSRARNGDHTRQRVAQDLPTSALRAIVQRSRHARNCPPPPYQDEGAKRATRTDDFYVSRCIISLDTSSERTRHAEATVYTDR